MNDPYLPCRSNLPPRLARLNTDSRAVDLAESAAARAPFDFREEERRMRRETLCLLGAAVCLLAAVGALGWLMLF